MNQEEAASILQSIFIEKLNIPSLSFDWEKNLEELNENFKMLGYLVLLEQLIQKQFGKNIPIIENITTGFHTPHDVLELIFKHALK